MRHARLHPKTWIAGSAGILSVATTAAMLAAFTGGASAVTSRVSHVVHARPRLAAQAASAGTQRHPVVPFVQEFKVNTAPFCPPASGNAPCDGVAPNDYGTIDRVPSHFSNGGGGDYAPFTKALHGSWMALVSGTQTINEGPSQGCPVPGTEACTGPYALFGTGKAMGAENVFPKHGFTVTDDLYLSPSTVANAGSLVDDDIALNTSKGTFGIDNVITACAEQVPGVTPAQMGFVVNFGNNSPGSCAGTPVITKDGWYRFVFVFRNIKGQAYLTRYVRTEKRGKVVARTAAEPIGGTPTSIKNWGGPLYFWLPTLQMSGMPLANFALQLGTIPSGHRP